MTQLLLYIFLQSHRIPISAIPCLNYRRALEKEKANEAAKTTAATDATTSPTAAGTSKVSENREIESVKNAATESEGQ